MMRSISKEDRSKRGQWIFSGIAGALCFVVDPHTVLNFRVFRVKDLKEVFSVQIADNLTYSKFNDHFHYFKSEDCLCGFNFANTEQADKFYNIVINRLQKRAGGKAETVKRSSRKSFPGISFYGSKKKTETSRKSKSASRPSKASKASDGSKEQLFSANDFTPEWIKILKDAGVKKKDFRKPEIQRMLKKILEDQNISTQEPPKMTPEEARKHYDAQQFEAYQKYEKQQQIYEAQYQNYLTDLEKYNESVNLPQQPRTQSVPAVVAENRASVRKAQSPNKSFQSDSVSQKKSRKESFTPVILPSSRKSKTIKSNDVAGDTFRPEKTFDLASPMNSYLPIAPDIADTQSILGNQSVKPVFNLIAPRPPALPPVSYGHDSTDQLESDVNDFFDDVVFSKVSKEKSKINNPPFPSNRKDSLALMTNEHKMLDRRPPPVPPRKSSVERKTVKISESVQEHHIPDRPARPSEDVIQNKFFHMLRHQKANMKPVSSILPDLGALHKSAKNSIMVKIQDEMDKRRDEIVRDEEDGDSDWSVG